MFANRQTLGWWLAFLCIGSLGCHRSGSTTTTPSVPASRGPSADDVRAMTAMRYDHALFIKPSDVAASRREGALAPIIVQQTFHTDPAMALGDRFGAVVVGAGGDIVVDPTRPTVYLARGAATIQNSTLEQLIYVWFYNPPAGGASEPAWRGIRLTLADRDFPIIQEVLSSTDSPHVPIYVFQSLESATSRAFGPAVPCRSFSVEQPQARQPRVVVPRILSDGQIPQGPLVYVDAGTRTVTTLLCRCMASQIENTVESPYYDLQPLESLPAARGLPRSMPDLLRGRREAMQPRWLEQALRLPPLF